MQDHFQQYLPAETFPKLYGMNIRWKEAMDNEIAALQQNNTCMLLGTRTSRSII